MIRKRKGAENTKPSGEKCCSAIPATQRFNSCPQSRIKTKNADLPGGLGVGLDRSATTGNQFDCKYTKMSEKGSGSLS